jgi:hypothetical protein
VQKNSILSFFGLIGCWSEEQQRRKMEKVKAKAKKKDV